MTRELVSLDVRDFSVLLDCAECGVRLRLRGVLGIREQGVLEAGLGL